MDRQPGGRVVLVCGPPCAGKSSHVRKVARPGDILVCFDELAQRAGSPHHHDHSPEHLAAAGRAYQRALTRLHAGWPGPGTAWVIRCAPTADERRQLAERIHADEVLVLAPPMPVALARATRSHRSPSVHDAIRRWYAAQQPDVGVDRQALARPRLCLGCREPTRHGSRCPRCETSWQRPRNRVRDARRGTTSQRGYGPAHQAERERWRPLVDAGQVDCWRCGRPIRPGQPWDLGHDDLDRTRYRGPEHPACNRRGPRPAGTPTR